MTKNQPQPNPRDWDDSLLLSEPAHFHQYIGVYADHRDLLLRLAALAQGRLENIEQLHVLEHGEIILVSLVDEPTCEIDTPADYAAFVARRLAG